MNDMYLPTEIWTNIIGFIEDKIYISMTCKFLQNLCMKVYEDSENIYYSDPYDVNAYYNKKRIMLNKKDLKDIENYNSLNCIFRKIFLKNGKCIQSWYDTNNLNEWYTNPNIECKNVIQYEREMTQIIYILLLQYLRMDNISKPENLQVMIKMIHMYSKYVADEAIADLLSEAFTQNNKEMISILMEHKYIRKCWFLSFKNRYEELGDYDGRYGDYGCRVDMINEIEMVVENGFITYFKIYMSLYKITTEFYMKKDILKYLKYLINNPSYY